MSADWVPISKSGTISSTKFVSKVADADWRDEVGPPTRALLPSVAGGDVDNGARLSLIAPAFVTVTEPEEDVIDLVEPIEGGTAAQIKALSTRSPNKPPPHIKRLNN